MNGVSKNVPIATSATQLEKTVPSTSTTTTVTLKNRRGSNMANPVVAAMLGSNMLNNCRQVQDMYAHCQLSHTTTSICDTAVQYMEICISNGEIQK